MKAGTVVRHARKLRRICDDARGAGMVGVDRIYGPVVVGDLPPFTMMMIAVWAQTDRVEVALRQWIGEQRASVSDLTPWGETYEACARAALDDPDAPGVLKLAAWWFLHGRETTFRSLIGDAVALGRDEGS